MRQYVGVVALALLLAGDESGSWANCDHDCRNRGHWIYKPNATTVVCRKTHVMDCRFCVDVGHDGCTGNVDPGSCQFYLNGSGQQVVLEWTQSTGGTCTSACPGATPGVEKTCQANVGTATFGQMVESGLSVKTCGAAEPIPTTDPTN